MPARLALLAVLLAVLGTTHADIFVVPCCAFADVLANLTAAIDGDVVALSPGTYTAAASSLPVSIASSVTLTGLGSTTLSLAANPGFLSVGGAAAVRVANLTFTAATNGPVLATSASAALEVQFCTFTGVTTNVAVGAAVSHRSSGALSVANSIFTSVTFATSGASIIHVNGTGAFTMAQCAFSGNSGSGGAVRVLGASTASVSTTSFTSMTATGSAMIYGGFGGPLTVTSCTFTSNSGVGISLSNGRTTVTGSTFSRCQTSTTVGGTGMVIIAGATASVSDCVFLSNSAKQDAAAIYTGGVTNITRSYFYGHQLTGFLNGYGGAIYSDCGTLDIRNTNFTSNSAVNGAAVYLESGLSTANFVNCTFTSNLARYVIAGAGAGIYVDGEVVVNITNSNFISNSALINGAGLYCACGACTVTNTNFLNNVAGGCGGAIYGEDTSPYPFLVTGGNFTNNQAGSGAAIHLESSILFFKVTGTTFIGNSANSGSGGAIEVDFTGASLTNCVFRNNVASSTGGAVSLYAPATVTGTSFVGNRAGGGNGGGGLASITSGTSLLLLTNTNFTSNSATSSNGGALTALGLATLTSCFFTSNTASAGNGGGIYVQGAAQISVCGFTSNSGYAGGAVQGGNVTATNTRFTTNKATIAGTGHGGAINTAAGAVYLSNAVFTQNTAQGNGGAVSGLTVSSLNTQYVKNVAILSGGAVYGSLNNNWTRSSCSQDSAGRGGCVYGARVQMRDSIVTGTTAGFGGGVYISLSGNLVATLTNVLLTGTSASSDGGGIYVTGAVSTAAQAILTNVTISSAHSNMDAGGLMVASNFGSVRMIGSSIENCGAGGNGGGVSVKSGASATFVATMIKSNNAALNGGGLYLNASTMSLNCTTVLGNVAALGGGLYSTKASYILSGNTTVDCNSATTATDGIYCDASIAVVQPTVQIAGSGTGDLVTCAGCTGQCGTCTGCNGGCAQDGSGCYASESPCTSCPYGFQGPTCTPVPGCPANNGCPTGAPGATCTISCDSRSLPNPAINLTAVGTITCVGNSGGWTYSNACIPCPAHHFGPACSQVDPFLCGSLPGAVGLLTGCAPAFLYDQCTPTCDSANHYTRNSALSFPLTCVVAGNWTATSVCVPIPLDCNAFSAGPNGVLTGCPGAYTGAQCTPGCAVNYSMDPAYAFGLPLTCGAVGGWTPGPSLCRPCTPGTFGVNCSQVIVNFCQPLTGTGLSLTSTCRGVVGESCSFSCADGTTNTTKLTSTCLSTGSWSVYPVCSECASQCATCNVAPPTSTNCLTCGPGWYSVPSCSVAVVCGSYPSQATFTSACTVNQQYNYLSTCQLSCTYGAINTTITCIDFLTWSEPAVACPNPFAPPPPPPASPPPPPASPPASAPPPAPSDSGPPPVTSGPEAIVTPPPSVGGSGVAIGVAAAAAIIVVGLIVVIVIMKRKKNTGKADGDVTMRVESGAKKRLDKMLKNAPIVGKGMTAVVYRAALEDGTPVAIKMSMANTEASITEFHREAHVLGLLMGTPHQNIISMKFFSDQPRAIVMDLADAGTVRNLLKNGRPDNALDLVRQIAEGVYALHEFNVAHLDLKPENVLVTAEGICKITDFGCAVLCGTGEKFSAGVFVGTPQYSAPERFLIGTVDPKAADAYSFALTVWSVYEAASPFVGETYESLTLKCQADVTFPLKELTMAAGTPQEVISAVVLGVRRDIRSRGTMRTIREVLSDTMQNGSFRSFRLDSTASSTSLDSAERVSLMNVNVSVHNAPLDTVSFAGSTNNPAFQTLNSDLNSDTSSIAAAPMLRANRATTLIQGGSPGYEIGDKPAEPAQAPPGGALRNTRAATFSPGGNNNNPKPPMISPPPPQHPAMLNSAVVGLESNQSMGSFGAPMELDSTASLTTQPLVMPPLRPQRAATLRAPSTGAAPGDGPSSSPAPPPPAKPVRAASTSAGSGAGAGVSAGGDDAPPPTPDRPAVPLRPTRASTMTTPKPAATAAGTPPPPVGDKPAVAPRPVRTNSTKSP